MVSGPCPALPIPLSALVLNHTLTDDSLVLILPGVGGQILPLMLRLWAYFESVGPFDMYINLRISLLNPTHTQSVEMMKSVNPTDESWREELTRLQYSL